MSRVACYHVRDQKRSPVVDRQAITVITNILQIIWSIVAPDLDIALLLTAWWLVPQ